MPTANTNIALKGTNDAGGVTAQGPLRTGSEENFTKALDGASLAGIRGYSDKADYADGPRMVLRWYSNGTRMVRGWYADGTRMVAAGTRMVPDGMQIGRAHV